MLKIVLGAIFIAEICASVEKYHKKGHEEYTNLLSNDVIRRFPYTTVIHEWSPQNILIKPYTETRLNFNVEPLQDQDVYFSQSKEYFLNDHVTLRTVVFDFGDSYLHLVFKSGQNVYSVSSKLFTAPEEDEVDLLRHSQERAYRVQLIPEETIDNLLSQSGQLSTAKATLGIAWIKEFFEEGAPLFKEEDQAAMTETYIGYPLTIKAETATKLIKLTEKMKDAKPKQRQETFSPAYKYKYV